MGLSARGSSARSRTISKLGSGVTTDVGAKPGTGGAGGTRSSGTSSRRGAALDARGGTLADGRGGECEPGRGMTLADPEAPAGATEVAPLVLFSGTRSVPLDDSAGFGLLSEAPVSVASSGALVTR